jgi:hypothetical protein
LNVLLPFHLAAVRQIRLKIPVLVKNTRTYKKGLRTPGQATVGLNADPENDSHLLLSNLAESNDQQNLTFAVGWADGESLPVATVGDPDAVDGLVLPDDAPGTFSRVCV